MFKELLVSILSEGAIELPIDGNANVELAKLKEDLSIATLATS